MILDNVSFSSDSSINIISTVVVHLSWPKLKARTFCEADEVAFYMISGKWGVPTKLAGRVN